MVLLRGSVGRGAFDVLPFSRAGLGPDIGGSGADDGLEHAGIVDKVCVSRAAKGLDNSTRLVGKESV
jgi:hypothetical protein